MSSEREIPLPAIRHTAEQYLAAGLCVLPISPQAKNPWFRWEKYQHFRPLPANLAHWFRPGLKRGVCIVAGEISGQVLPDGTICGLEFLDIDDPVIAQDFVENARWQGLSELVDRLPKETTPREGLHMAWYCSLWEGSQVLAERPIPDAIAPEPRKKTLIETRGEGSLCVVDPTPAGIHPERPENAYTLTSGSWLSIPVISPADRHALLDFARSYNEYTDTQNVLDGPEAGRAAGAHAPASGASLSPGEASQALLPGQYLNSIATADWWQQLLEAHGWKLVALRRGIQYWRRPGKHSGSSATFGATGPYFYVFSSNAAPFEARKACSAFHAYALLEHGGNHSEAAAAVRQLYNLPVVPAATALAATNHQWQTQLQLSKGGVIMENLSNIMLLLENHPDWHGAFWFDAVRLKAMVKNEALTDTHVTNIAAWLGMTPRMSVKGLRLVERAILALCARHERDLLKEWLEALPAWDTTPRLTDGLSDIAEVPKTAYSMDIARLLPVSMVARALNPGCQYRYVVILEAPENTGKSELVKTLASLEWYRELSIALESKEAHMLLQGAWLAEFAELDSFSRTKLTRLKGFITLREDVWIPKFSNFSFKAPRRTVFVGTTNDSEYLYSQTGNTRFLPITIGQVDIAALETMRPQLFAEALTWYAQHPTDWWQLSPEGSQGAIEAREEKRVGSVFESALGVWLDTRPESVLDRDEDGKPGRYTFTPGETSWEEIAHYYLKLPLDRWADKNLQMQIAEALEALHYVSRRVSRAGKQVRRWLKK